MIVKNFFTANRANEHKLFILKRLFTHLVFIFIAINIFFFFSSCAKNETSRIELALGTVCTITLFDNGNDNIYNEIFSRIHEIENLMSVNIPTSDVSRVNAAAGIAPVQVHEDVFKVIERAAYFAEISGGAFDPTVGPLVSLWGIGGENPRVPSIEEIYAVLPLVNFRFMQLDAETRSVFLIQQGMALDLGAIAKGYAADEAAKIARNAKVKQAKIDLGGNIVLVGMKIDKSPWRVGIQSPGNIHGTIAGLLQVTEKTIVTSGIYERQFEENGKSYHHIFDPSTGYPAEKNLASVTLITDISMDADALSTAVFVLGYNAGIKLLESFPGTEAVFVFEDKSIRTTAGANFSITDRAYTIVN